MSENLCYNAQARSTYPKRTFQPRRPVARSFGHTLAATTLRALLFLTLILGLVSNATSYAAPHTSPANPAELSAMVVLTTTATKGN